MYKLLIICCKNNQSGKRLNLLIYVNKIYAIKVCFIEKVLPKFVAINPPIETVIPFFSGFLLLKTGTLILKPFPAQPG
jgi:hypothetical protein